MAVSDRDEEIMECLQRALQGLRATRLSRFQRGENPVQESYSIPSTTYPPNPQTPILSSNHGKTQASPDAQPNRRKEALEKLCFFH